MDNWWTTSNTRHAYSRSQCPKSIRDNRCFITEMMTGCCDPKRLKKYSYARLELCMWCSNVGSFFKRDVLPLVVLLIHQSATHQCGINQSCACVVIMRMLEPWSQGAKYTNKQMQSAHSYSPICHTGNIFNQPTTDGNHNVSDEEYRWLIKTKYWLPVEAHLEICSMLSTGKCGDCFSLLGYQLEHLRYIN